MTIGGSLGDPLYEHCRIRGPVAIPLVWLIGLATLLAPVLAQRAQFVDVTESAGLHFQHQNFATSEKYLVETMGSGGAFVDYDNDGLLDIYLVNGAPLGGDTTDAPTNKLFRNLGNGRFQDVTEQAGVGDRGYGMGVAVADFDNDGRPDLYVTNFGVNVLYHNRGDGTFEDVTRKAGVGDPAWGASAGFFDYDRDGDLDLYVVNYLDFTMEKNIECTDYDLEERTYCHPHHFNGVADRLYRNNGDGTFTDVSVEAGIANPEGKGLGVVFTDFDRDGWPDIYVANDSVGNFLYRNLKDGRFEDVTLVSTTGFSSDGRAEAGMGTDAADLTGDGYPELFVTNLDFETNSLYVNQSQGWFEDETARRGLAEPGFLKVGFGTAFLDYDNDGDLDLFVVNGHILDNIQSSKPWLSYPQQNQLFENEAGRFREVTADAGQALQVKQVGRGLARGDYDNDGDVDLLITNCGGTPQLLRNETGGNNRWLRLKLRGTRSNRQGLGAKVRIISSKGTAHYDVTASGSYLSGHDPRLHIGLGPSPGRIRLELEWPSGFRQVIDPVPANREIEVEEPTGRLPRP